MRRAIGDLEQFADDRLFEALSEGLPLIVDNAASLHESACRLHREGEARASEVMRGFAEEEAAKFLILIDYVRCPRIPERRSQVLKRFYGHVAKRIHAEACAYPRIQSFEELCEFVESECRPWYLDGPNDVDWIFPTQLPRSASKGSMSTMCRTSPTPPVTVSGRRPPIRLPLFHDMRRPTVSPWFKRFPGLAPVRPRGWPRSPMSGERSCLSRIRIAKTFAT